MPGDFHERYKEDEIRCRANSWYNGRNGSIWDFPDTRTKARLFASLPDNPSDLFPLEFIRSVSGDTNQNNNTVIWHGRLPTRIKEVPKAKQHLALRMTIHVGFAQEPMANVAPILTVDIPLSTGVVGQAGPQIIGSSRQTARQSSLCVAVYGDDALHYLPEFILHHTQLGFGPIVVGVVDATIGSLKLQNVENVLQDFVNQGLVDIAAMGLPSPLDPPLDCEVNEHMPISCQRPHALCGDLGCG